MPASLDLIGVSFEPALIATGHAGRALQVRIARTGVLFATLAVLMPYLGTMGAALGMVASAILGLGLSAITTRKALAKAQKLSDTLTNRP